MTMNGRADIVGEPIDLGTFLPEKRFVKLNGETYEGWVATNRRYPRNVKIKLDKASAKYVRAIAPLLWTFDEGVEPTEEQNLAIADALDNQPNAWSEYVQEAIRLLVPGVLESELELVDTDILHKCGQDLGYFPQTEEPTAEDAPAAQEPGEAESQTGESSPESSGASTPVRTRTHS